MSTENKDIVIENQAFRLVVGVDCVTKSLLCKANGEECLAVGVKLPLFSVTQERPYNNEIKLAYPCKRTTFNANRIRKEGSKLIIGFNLIPYEAIVTIAETPAYINFSLDGFDHYYEDYKALSMDAPPVSEFCLLQIPVKDRDNFGEWLNVVWDNNTAVNILSTAPETLVEAQAQDGYRIMRADVSNEICLKGPGAALIVTESNQLMDSIASVEADYNLPRGVDSRRSPYTNASIYWVRDLSPENVDEHIQFAKSGGFRMMLVYYTCMFHEDNEFLCTGCYDQFRPEYPNGKEDLIRILDKIKSAGLIPGLHFLHTHIGKASRYITPVADHRLHLKQHFTLARALNTNDTTIYVEQNPMNAPMAEGCRLLQFGGELISYEGFSAQRPYCFTGCKRGAIDTIITEHPLGQIGGILDVSEFLAESVYLDQDSSLSEEIAQKLADVYNCGFRFVYFDGSEGTNPPFAYHIPNAQYRVFKKLSPPPLFAEGAAKAHFSWHMLSGGNAFDIFKPDEFKEMIGLHPAAEAPRMQKDFTRVNFGWWAYWGPETQADMYEFGTSRAAAWDCPITLQANLDRFKASPRFTDVFEVLRRWEDARATNWVTQEYKKALRQLDQEHILLINESMEYELAPYDRIDGAACNHPYISAFSFTRNGESYVVYWHHNDTVTLNLPINSTDVELFEELWEAPIPVTLQKGNTVSLPTDKRRYIKSKLPVEILIEAFKNATITE